MNAQSPKNPLVSVIIPCYNLGQYLEEAVDSVLKQTFQNFEIIIVDDGSTDEGTRELLAQFQRPKTQLFTKKNEGVAIARNFGISKAQGKYILPLDADDMLASDYLEKTVSVLQGSNEVDFVTTWAKIFGNEDGIWKTIVPKNEYEILLDNTIATATLYKKSCWERVGGYDKKINKIGYYEDWDLWISFIEAGCIGATIEEPLFHYRKRKSSMLKEANKLETRLDLLGFLIKKHEYIYKKNFLSVLIEKDRAFLNQMNSNIYLNKIIEKEEKIINQKDGEIDSLINELDNIRKSKLWGMYIFLKKIESLVCKK